MQKAIGLYLVWAAIVWFIVFSLGVELDKKEKIQIGFGIMGLLIILEVGVYLLNGGF